MLLSLRKNGLTSLFKEVRVFKVFIVVSPSLTFTRGAVMSRKMFANLGCFFHFRAIARHSSNHTKAPHALKSVSNPEGPNLEKNQSRLNAWKFQVFAWKCPEKCLRSWGAFFILGRLCDTAVITPRRRMHYAITLRAKGTLISEPRFSNPCEMRFFPREKGKIWPLSRVFPWKGRFPFLAWKNASRRGYKIGAH